VLRLVRPCGLDLEIAVVDRDDSDWVQACRLLALSPDQRLERATRVVVEMRALRGPARPGSDVA